MDYTDLKKKFWWFTLIFFVLLLVGARLLCQCTPWDLIVTLYIFFILYLFLSIGGKSLLEKLRFNPLTYMVVSFLTKVVLVIGFAFALIQFFDLPRKTILALLVSGYLIAAIFDFIMLVKTTKNDKL